MSYDYLFKIVLMGDARVGKTSYADRLCVNSYHNDYRSTLGVDFHCKNVILHDNIVIKTHIWDTAGQDKFRSIVETYYKEVAGAVIMYDITNRNSFNRIEEWKSRIYKYQINNINIPIILIGCKTDIDFKREVTKNEAEEYANKNNMLYYEISNKKGINVEESYKKLIYDIFSRMDVVNLSPGIKRHFSQEELLNEKNEIRACKKFSFSCCTII
jgi:Ras-related protein Rab-1A